MRTSLLAAAALTLTLVSDPALGAAAPPNTWIDAGNYNYKLDGIPDFDQQRTGLVGPPGAHPGSMHCGPTAGMNMAAFLAANGFPTLLVPGDANLNWQAQANFAKATNHIATMASASHMGCLCQSPFGGTNVAQFAKGLLKAIAVGKVPLEVGAYAPTGTFAPNLNQIAAAGLDGYIMSMAYGYYKVIGITPGGYRVVVRQGGHFVTVSGAARNDGEAKIWVRDPASPQPPNINTQSEFKNGMYHVQTGWVFVIEPNGFGRWRWMSRISTAPNPQPPGIQGQFWLIDAIVGVRPAAAIGRDEDGNMVRVRPIPGWLGGGEVCEIIEPPVNLKKARPDAQGRGVVGVVGGQGVAGDDDGLIGRFDPLTGDFEIVAEIPGAEQLAIGRRHAAFVLADGQLHRVELPSSAEEPQPEDEGGAAGSDPLAIPHAVQAMTYDDVADRVVLLSVADRVLMLADEDLKTLTTVALPDELPLRGSASIDVGEDIIWIVSEASNSMWGVGIQQAADKPTVTVTEVAVEGVKAPRSIGVLGSGHLIVAHAGGLVELAQPEEADGWGVVEDSPWAEAACAFDDVVVSRPRTNFNPGDFDDPAYINLPPEDLEPGNPEPDPLCFGDLNGDGLVDSADLGILLMAWGPGLAVPGDFNADGMVDGADLGLLLNAWGPCPE